MLCVAGESEVHSAADNGEVQSTSVPLTKCAAQEDQGLTVC